MLVAALVAMAGLAGCAEQPGTDGGLDEGAEARTAYQNAVSLFDEGPSEADRVAVSLSVTGGESPGSMETLFAAEKSLLVMTMEGAFADDSMSMQGDMAEMLVGQVHKSTFFGIPDTGVLGFYNESQEPPEGFTSADTDPEASGGPGEDGETSPFTDPDALFDTLDEAPENATFSSSQITYDGEPALEIRAEWTENGTTYDVSVVVLTETEQLVRVEGEATGGEEGDHSFEMDVAYGDDATHPQEEALFRAETMIFSQGEPDPFSGQQSGSSDGTTNHTIQPSQNPGTIALGELSVLAVPDAQEGDSQGPTPPALTLSADEGTTENEDVRLTYEDADGDGMVSPGDEIVLEDLNTSDEATFTVELRDEETGLRLAPGPGLVLGVLVLGAAALVRRRA